MIQFDIALFVFSLFAKYSIISFLVIIPINTLLDALYELKINEKSERNYVRFLGEYGMSQLAINKATGIGLRKIKSYLTGNETKEAK